MTDTVDMSLLALIVWTGRLVQAVLVGLGLIFVIGALQMPVIEALFVFSFVAVLWILALVIQMLGIAPAKERASQ